jgi:hypothetical protein
MAEYEHSRAGRDVPTTMAGIRNQSILLSTRASTCASISLAFSPTRATATSFSRASEGVEGDPRGGVVCSVAMFIYLVIHSLTHSLTPSLTQSVNQ